MTSSAHKFATARSMPIAGLAKDYLTAALGSSFVVPSTGLTDIPAMLLPLRAGTNYIVRAWFASGQTVATGQLGVGMNFTGTLSGLGLWYSAVLNQPGTAQTSNVSSSANGVIQDSVARAASGWGAAYIDALIGVSTAGNLVTRAQRSAGTHTIFVGSMVAWEL